MPSPNDITKFMRADAVRHVRRTSRLYWRADAPDYATIDGPRRKPKFVYLGGKFRTQAAAVEAVVRFWTGERDMAAFVVERDVDGKAMFVPSVGQYRVEPWGGYTLSLAAESRPAAELAARALLLALYSVNRKFPAGGRAVCIGRGPEGSPPSDPPPAPGSRDYLRALRFVRRSDRGRFSAVVYVRGRGRYLGTFGREDAAVAAVLRFQRGTRT